jgi:hypothetical protein
VHAVVLVELVLLLEAEASALVGDGYCCWRMQWCSSSWCFSSGREHRRWLAMVTAADGCSGARRAGDPPRGESIGVGWRWSLLLVHAVVLVELVLLFEAEASALVGDGDCCWCMQWCSSSWCFSSGREHQRWLAVVTAGGGGSGARRAGASLRGESIVVGWQWSLLLGAAVVLVELVLLLVESIDVGGRR